MAGQKLAYVRVSSDGQSTSRQDQVIAEKNVDKIFTEKVSGRNISDRPQFQAMLEYARDQDIIYCADLSRWGRSMVDIRTTITYLTKKGVTVEFIKENLTFSNKNDDTSNLLLGILSSLSEWERAVIKSRQMEGVKIAQERGVYKDRCGRKPKLSEEQIQEVIRRVNAGENRTEIAKDLRVSRQTIYNLVPSRTGRSVGA